jgi:hypothetical protein
MRNEAGMNLPAWYKKLCRELDGVTDQDEMRAICKRVRAMYSVSPVVFLRGLKAFAHSLKQDSDVPQNSL